METKQSAKYAPQEEINAQFDDIINEEVKRDFAEIVEGMDTPAEVLISDVGEPEPVENSAKPERKLSWREKMSDKLGKFGAKTAIAFENLKEKASKHKVAAAALTLVGLAGTSYAMHKFGTAPTGANAGAIHDTVAANPEHLAFTTNVNVGGNGDSTSKMMHHLADGYGLKADKSVDIPYAAQIAPKDPTTLNASTAEATPKTYHAIMDARANGGNVRVNMYSQGTQAGNNAVKQIIQENGGTKPDWLEINYFASPNTPTSGVFNGSEARALKPVFDMFGADIEAGEIPKGAHVIAYDTDFWANSGNKPLTTMASNGIGTAFGDGHAFPNPNDPHTTYVKDGITYTTYHHKGTQNAALRAAEQHGMLVTKEADNFAQAIAPTGDLGTSSQINAQDVLKTAGPLIDDTARRAGIASPNATEVLQNVPAAPVQAAVDTFTQVEQGVTDAAAQAFNGGGGNGANYAQQLTDTVNQVANTFNGGGNTAAPAQQITDTVNQAVNSFTQGAPDVQKQVNNVLGGLLPR